MPTTKLDDLYFLFSGENYYPAGGASDYRDTYHSLDDAKAAFDPHHDDWAQIAVLRDGRLVIILEHGSYMYTDTNGWHNHSADWHEPRDDNRSLNADDDTV